MNDRLDSPLWIDRNGVHDAFTKRMRDIALAFHHNHMSTRERIDEEIKAIREYLMAMTQLVVGRE